MNHISSTYKFIIILLVIAFLLYFIDLVAIAYHDNTTYPYDSVSVYDLWNISSAESRSRQLVDFLIDNDWVKSTVTREDVNHICCMASQLSSHYEDISSGLVIAMIALESRFDTNALSNGGARGLMQLLPSYHEDRLIQFLENDERYSRDLFYDPLYNIMTGMDYLHQILGQTNGDVSYALMWYNQGAVSACDNYVERGITSYYAKIIVQLSVEIDKILDIPKT